MDTDNEWMKIALNEAALAEQKGEVPIGAILIKNNNIIAKAHNQSILNHDATAHAEIQLIRLAGKIEKNYRLIDSTLYVTLEPCIMCLGAIIHARIGRLVFGAYDLKIGACVSHLDLINTNLLNHKMILTGGVLENECKQLLQSFFQAKRIS